MIGLSSRQAKTLRLELRLLVSLTRGQAKLRQAQVTLLVADLASLRQLHDVLHGLLVGKRCLLLAANVSLTQLRGLTEALRALLGNKAVALTRCLTSRDAFLHRLTATTKGASSASLRANLLPALRLCAVKVGKPGLDDALLVWVLIVLNVAPQE